MLNTSSLAPPRLTQMARMTSDHDEEEEEEQSASDEEEPDELQDEIERPARQPRMGKRQEPRESRQEVQDEITDELDELDVEVAAIRIQHGQEWLTVPEYISRKNGSLSWHEANLINRASYIDPSADYRVAYNNALGQRDPRFQQQPDQQVGGAAQQPPGTPPPPPGPPRHTPSTCPEDQIQSKNHYSLVVQKPQVHAIAIRPKREAATTTTTAATNTTTATESGATSSHGGATTSPPILRDTLLKGPPHRPQMPPPPTKSSAKPKLQLPKWGGGAQGLVRRSLAT